MAELLGQDPAQGTDDDALAKRMKALAAKATPDSADPLAARMAALSTQLDTGNVDLRDAAPAPPKPIRLAPVVVSQPDAIAVPPVVVKPSKERVQAEQVSDTIRGMYGRNPAAVTIGDGTIVATGRPLSGRQRIVDAMTYGGEAEGLGQLAGAPNLDEKIANRLAMARSHGDRVTDAASGRQYQASGVELAAKPQTFAELMTHIALNGAASMVGLGAVSEADDQQKIEAWAMNGGDASEVLVPATADTPAITRADVLGLASAGGALGGAHGVGKALAPIFGGLAPSAERVAASNVGGAIAQRARAQLLQKAALDEEAAVLAQRVPGEVQSATQVAAEQAARAKVERVLLMEDAMQAARAPAQLTQAGQAGVKSALGDAVAGPASGVARVGRALRARAPLAKEAGKAAAASAGAGAVLGGVEAATSGERDPATIAKEIASSAAQWALLGGAAHALGLEAQFREGAARIRRGVAADPTVAAALEAERQRQAKLNLVDEATPVERPAEATAEQGGKAVVRTGEPPTSQAPDPLEARMADLAPKVATPDVTTATPKAAEVAAAPPVAVDKLPDNLDPLRDFIARHEDHLTGAQLRQLLALLPDGKAGIAARMERFGTRDVSLPITPESVASIKHIVDFDQVRRFSDKQRRNNPGDLAHADLAGLTRAAEAHGVDTSTDESHIAGSIVPAPASDEVAASSAPAQAEAPRAAFDETETLTGVASKNRGTGAVVSQAGFEGGHSALPGVPEAHQDRQAGWEDGFVTSTGRFVDRREALNLARARHQLRAAGSPRMRGGGTYEGMGDRTKLEAGDVVPLRAVAPAANAPVDSPEFKRWFADSKVTDAQGAPLTVYHGTRRDFDTFRPGMATGWGEGIYFTDNAQQAREEYGDGPEGRVIAARVSITNPYRGDGIPEGVEDTAAWRKVAERWNGDVQDAWQEDSRFVGEALRELGYDGVIAERSNNIDGLEIVAFRPEQIQRIDAGSPAPTARQLKKGRGIQMEKAPPGGFTEADKVPRRLEKPGAHGVDKDPRTDEQLADAYAIIGEKLDRLNDRILDRKPGSKPAELARLRAEKEQLEREEALIGNAIDNRARARGYAPTKTGPESKHVDVAKLEAEAAKIPVTQDIDTPEREQWRNQRAAAMAKATKHEKRIDIQLGLPGAGKSSTADPLVAEHGSAEMDIDTGVKKHAPEWNGGLGASALHAEAVDVRTRAMDLATSQDANILFPTIGHPTTLVPMVKELIADGYDVHVHLVDVPPDVAVKRMLEGFKAGKRHFVPPAAILKRGDDPRRAFMALADLPGVTAHDPLDNNVARGAAARPIADWRERWASLRAEVAGSGEGPGRPGADHRDTPSAPRGAEFRVTPEATDDATAGSSRSDRAERAGKPVRGAAPDVAPGEPASAVSGDGGGRQPGGALRAGRGERGGDVRRADGARDAADERADVERGASGDAERRPPERDRGSDAGVGARAGRGDGAGAARGRVSVGKEDAPPVTAETAATPRADSPQRVAQNFRITDDTVLAAGGPKARIRANLDAIVLARTLAAESRTATPEEQAVLARYVGWGDSALAKVFDTFSDTAGKWAAERAELEAVLSPEEFARARASTLNAHYTSPEIIRGIYEGLAHLGVTPQAGAIRLLEPAAGVGHFLGLLPPGLEARATLIELDPTTASIARGLYPKADVRASGFEKVPLADDSFDVVVGNPPFGDYTLADPQYDKHRLLIHDYFFVRALDKLRPGGLLAFVTSNGTMDKANSKPRQLIAERADLLGAVRLPKTAFKANAGTEVVTDVLFFRRRAPGETSSGRPFVYTREVATSDGPARINEYFADHPEQVLGENRLTGSMYGPGQYTVEPREGAKSGAGLQAAMTKALTDVLPGNAFQPAPSTSGVRPRTAAELTEPDQAPAGLRDGWLIEHNGELHANVGGALVPAAVPKSHIPLVRDLVALREARVALTAVQLDDTATEAAFQKALKAANKQYDAFVKKYGPIRQEKVTEGVYKSGPNEGKGYRTVRRPNLDPFRVDPSYPLVASLEHYDSITGKASKADILERRIFNAPTDVTHVERVEDALPATLNKLGRVDVAHMAQLAGKSEAEVIKALRGQSIFEDPATERWLTADEYLSGNVREKLARAERMAATEPERWGENVAALKRVQPADLEPSQIYVKLGSAWVPREDYETFASATFGGQVTIKYAEAGGGSYHVQFDKRAQGSAASTTEYGTSHATGARILKDTLNQRATEITYKDQAGKTHKNVEATAEAQEKQAALKARFQEWVWEDGDRALRLAKKYNAEFNHSIAPKTNGDHMTIPGTASHVRGSPFQWSSWQTDAIWRIITKGNTLLAHVVGGGKTFTMIGAGMEMRRLGLVRKPVYVVPNHMLEQFATEFQQLYPGASLLVANKRDFEKSRRREFTARMASQDWDGVIMTHSSFERIGVSAAFQQKYINEQMERLTAEILEAKKDKTDAQIVKALENAKKKLGAKLARLMSEEKKDDLLSFEETGVDQLFIDEAHLFKNLAIISKMRGQATEGSERAFDLYMKTQLLHQRTPGRGVVFATGTPISNTMAELYTAQRYLQPDVLASQGIANFDDWAATFGETVASAELAPDGSGYRTKERFSKFQNIPELVTMFRQVADVRGAEIFPPDGVNGERPKRPPLIGGAPIMVTAKASLALKAFVKTLIARAEKVRAGSVDPSEDNFLKITGEGRYAAMDLRMVSPFGPADPEGKIVRAVGNIVAEWEATKAVRGAQLVFSDIGTPSAGKPKKKRLKKGREAPAAAETEGHEEAPEAEADSPYGKIEGVVGFTVYDEVKRSLIERGIPAKEIAFIHDAKTDLQKQQLFDAVKSGRIRVLLGSTEKMGAGTNVQDRLVALHDLDAPWRPSDIEQRRGRIERQGNLLWYQGKIPGIKVYRYGTEQSFDAYMWQTLERKALFINSVMKGDPSIRTMEDLDSGSMDMADMKAATSGNPKVKEKQEVDTKVAQLSLQQRQHRDGQVRVRAELASMAGQRQRLEAYQRGAEVDAAKVVDTTGDNFALTIGKKTLTDRAEAGETLRKVVEAALEEGIGTAGERLIGKLGAFPVKLVAEQRWLSAVPQYSLALEGSAQYYLSHTIEKGGVPATLVASLEGLHRNIPHAAPKYAQQLADLAEQRAGYEAQLGKTFDDAKLSELKARQRQLAIELKATEDAVKEEPTLPEGSRQWWEALARGEWPYRRVADKPTARDVLDDVGLDEPGDGPLFAPAGAPKLGAPIGAPTAQAKAKQAARVKTLAEIGRALAEMAGVPLRQGRFNAGLRRAAGAFFGKAEVARVVRFDRLDTVAHEVGHYISQAYLRNPTQRGAAGRGAPVLAPSAVRELVAMGQALYPAGKPPGGYAEEGIAQWANYYVTEPARLQSDAPLFTAWMEGSVFPKEAGLKAALAQARADFAEYQAAPSTARVDAMMDVNPTRRVLPTVRRLVTTAIDDLNEIREAVDAIGGSVSPARNAYILSRLTRGGAGMAEEMVLRGIMDPATGKRVTKGIAEVLGQVKPEDVQAFRRYLAAERTLEVRARGVDSGISAADARDVVARYKAKFRPLAEELWTISNALVDYRQAKGLLTPEEAATIKENNQRRVGFYRVFDEDETAARRGVGRGFGRNSSGLQKMKGSARKIVDPLESIITDVYRTVQQSHAADVLTALVQHAHATQGGGRVVEVLTEAPKRAVTVPIGRIMEQLEDLGFDASAVDPVDLAGVLTSFEPIAQPGAKEAKDLVRPLVIDGVRKWVQINDAPLYDALSGLGTPQMTAVMRMLSIPTRTLRAGATLTLEFIGRNPVRDAFTAAIYSRAGTRPPFWDFGRGLFHVLKQDQMYQEWRLDGGDNAAMLGLDRVNVQKHVKDLMRSKAKERVDWVLHPIDTLRMLSSLMENATRVGEYAGLRRKFADEGMPEADARPAAGLGSRDVTIDFARAGEHVRIVNQLIAFFNANVQGWDKLARELRRNPETVLPRLLAFITIPSILLYLLQKDDPAYQEVPRWQKMMAWVIVDRDANGNVAHIWRIPKPPDLGILFGSIPEQIVDYVYRKDPHALDGITAGLSTLNPVHIPNALAPLVEWAANYSFFTDRPLVPEGIAKLPAGEQATSRTGEAARLVGRTLHLSPAKIENTVKGYAGGLGTYGMDLGNMVVRETRAIAGADALARPQVRRGDGLTSFPGTKGFTIRLPQLDAQSVQDALDDFATADAHRQAWRRILETGDKDRGRGYFKAHEAAIRAVASRTDGLGGIGPLRQAHDLIVDAQRISRDADDETREWAAEAAVKAARAALAGQKVDRTERRQLRRDAAKKIGTARKLLRRSLKETTP